MRMQRSNATICDKDDFSHGTDHQGRRHFKLNSLNISYGPRHAKTCLSAYADSEGPDQPAHPHILIRAFAVRKQNHWILKNISMENKCPDETLRMCRTM